MPQSPSPIADDISRSINSVVEAIAPFFRELAHVISEAMKPDPFSRTTDPVRHPEGHDDPEEYA